MKIIESSYEAIYPFGENFSAMKRIELIARVSHRSEDKQTADSWPRFVKAVIVDHGDWSVSEHICVTVKFRVDRGLTHELVRHRLFSFTQESTRFVNGRKSYPEGLEFVKPGSIEAGTEAYILWEKSLAVAESAYLRMLDIGIAPQIARSVLPNSLASTIIMTGNLRSWRHFLLMRTSRETHPDLRAVTIPLLEEFKTRFPILFDDIIPEQRQKDNLEKAQ